MPLKLFSVVDESVKSITAVSNTSSGFPLLQCTFFGRIFRRQKPVSTLNTNFVPRKFYQNTKRRNWADIEGGLAMHEKLG